MSAYLLKRLLTIIPTLLGITLISFFIIKLAPGNPVSLKIRAAEGLKTTQLSQEIQSEVMKLYGLAVDLPKGYEDFIADWTVRIHGSDPKEQPKLTRRVLNWVGQNAIQYKIWVFNMARLDFGISFKDHRPVLEKIKDALPITLALNFLEILIVYFISVPLGVFSALHRDSTVDRFTVFILFILYSLPTFWVAYLLIMLLSTPDHYDWFPLAGYISQDAESYPFWSKLGNIAWHLVLPVTCMVYGGLAFLARFSRNTALEVIKADYIRTAKAKGLKRRKVIWRHMFRNQLIPLITLTGTLLPELMGGSIIIEQIFSIPGMGKLAFDSVLARDYPTIMAITTITAVLTLVNLLLIDLIYVWVDPRISFKSLETA